MAWVSRIIAVLALLAVGWAVVTALPAVVHGHPAYAVVLVLVALGAAAALYLHREARPGPTGWRRLGSVALALGGLGAVATVVYLRPFSAEEPALAAMQSDGAVTVTESATRIVMQPAAGAALDRAVFFQPGARVEARAYAAVLRPLAESGFPVVIVKQPLGVGFLATGAFESEQDAFPGVSAWVVGGHSLGGTVAVLDALDHQPALDSDRPVVGLLLHASYPASDVSDMAEVGVVSISGTNDGLATPADIEASRANLPGDAQFEAIEGAVHAFFGDYGPQPGDGEPTISHDEARTQISNLSVAAVQATVTGASVG